MTDDLDITGMTSSTCGIFQAESSRGERRGRGKLSVIVVLHNVIFYYLGMWLTLACSFASVDGSGDYHVHSR